MTTLSPSIQPSLPTISRHQSYKSSWWVSLSFWQISPSRAPTTRVTISDSKKRPNLKCLRAFLRASPHCFRVYRTSRKTVLLHAALNQTTPGVVPIALDALQQRDHWRLMSNRTNIEVNRLIDKKASKPIIRWTHESNIRQNIKSAMYSVCRFTLGKRGTNQARRCILFPNQGFCIPEDAETTT